MKPTVLRGERLKFLRTIYPESTDERTVVGILYQYHGYEPIVESLAYLADKGYVTLREVPHPYRQGERIRLFKVAPDGIDLIDGTTTDDAVIIIPDRS